MRDLAAVEEHGEGSRVVPAPVVAGHLLAVGSDQAASARPERVSVSPSRKSRRRVSVSFAPLSSYAAALFTPEPNADAQLCARHRKAALGYRPVNSATDWQVWVEPPSVVAQRSVPVPFTLLYAPDPPVQLMVLLYVALVLLVNWNVWL